MRIKPKAIAHICSPSASKVRWEVGDRRVSRILLCGISLRLQFALTSYGGWGLITSLPKLPVILDQMYNTEEDVLHPHVALCMAVYRSHGNCLSSCEHSQKRTESLPSLFLSPQ